MTTQTLITAEQFSSMSFDVPTELVRGELVEMTNPGGWHGRSSSKASINPLATNG